MAKKDLETADDLRPSIQHLSQAIVRVSRLPADLAAPKPTPPDESAPGTAPAGM